MKINPNVLNPINKYTEQVKNNNNTKTNDTKGARQSDKVDISKEAKELQTHLDTLKEKSEVREKLVESIKSRVQDGTYKPSPEKTAEGIIQEQKLDERV